VGYKVVSRRYDKIKSLRMTMSGKGFISSSIELGKHDHDAIRTERHLSP